MMVGVQESLWERNHVSGRIRFLIRVAQQDQTLKPEVRDEGKFAQGRENKFEESSLVNRGTRKIELNHSSRTNR